MNAATITSLTGWIACVLIGLEVVTPYLPPKNRLSEWLALLVDVRNRGAGWRAFVVEWLSGRANDSLSVRRSGRKGSQRSS